MSLLEYEHFAHFLIFLFDFCGLLGVASTPCARFFDIFVGSCANLLLCFTVMAELWPVWFLWFFDVCIVASPHVFSYYQMNRFVEQNGQENLWLTEFFCLIL